MPANLGALQQPARGKKTFLAVFFPWLCQPEYLRTERDKEAKNKDRAGRFFKKKPQKINRRMARI